jgi:prephenate dehydrogenase
MLFRKVAVIGVGLIGGSFALALKQAKACGHVVGAGRSPANMKLALDRGVIDSIEGDPAHAVEGADLVLVATPVGQFTAVFQKISASLEADAIVTDAGSTKREVVEAARKALKKKVAQFVPGHPIAGAEKSGVVAASAELFRGRRVVITPLPENSEEAVEKLNQAWSTCGARTSRMSPEQHDEVFATLAAELLRYSKKLGEMKKLLESKDAAALVRLFTEARAARDDWLQRTWSGRKPGI